MQAVKGMVQVGGTTFRIERVGPSRYDVFRIVDDERIGAFQTAPVKVLEHHVPYELMRDIALCAVHEGKISWAHRLP